ncbi:PaaX family transcriptional regulator C-terminal domain-containing protein [Roseobacter sp. A03A-229]
MTHPLHPQLVNCLTGDTPPRVWSLLVTVFGDLAQAPDAQISGRALSVLCDAIGIKPAALRVALHRLRKDGWIESQRTGRQSFHRLTDFGLQHSIAATPRIYGRTEPQTDAWLSIFERGDSDDASGVWVTPNTLISAENPARADAFTTQLGPGNRLPDWLSNKICPPEMLAHAVAFEDRLGRCAALLRNNPTMTPLDVAVLRVLIVHGWRRIVLKIPELPDHVFPTAWPGESCRRQVNQLLTDHPRVNLTELENSTTSAT